MKKVSALCDFPMAMFSEIDSDAVRFKRPIAFTQFPINVANARTVHKLQGRTILVLYVSSWSYTGNWIYVVLSRCTRLGGLYVRLPLDASKVTGRGMSEECRAFLELFRETKKPLPDVVLHRGDE